MTMDALAKSRKPERAEALLYRMLEDPKYLKFSNLNIAFDIVINAWAQLGTLSGAKRANEILQRLEQLQRDDLRPTSHSYSTGIMNFFFLPMLVVDFERS